jgi:hypothetical protein
LNLPSCPNSAYAKLANRKSLKHLNIMKKSGQGPGKKRGLLVRL